MPTPPVFGVDQQDQSTVSAGNAAQTNQTRQMYAAVAAMDQILQKANLSPDELQAFKDAYNHGNVSPAIQQQLMQKMGITATQWNTFMDLQRTKKAYEAFQQQVQANPGGFSQWLKDHPGKSADDFFWSMPANAANFGMNGGMSKDYGTWGNAATQLGNSATGLPGQPNSQNPAAGTGTGSDTGTNAPIDDAYARYIQGLGGPAGTNPYDQALGAQAGGQAAMRAAGAGIQGGLSGANTQQAVANAEQGSYLQRMGLVAGGLSALSSRDLALRQQALQQLQYQNQVNMQNQAAQQNSAANIGGVIGGGLDAALGAFGIKDNGALNRIGSGIGGMTVPTTPLQGTSGIGGYSGPSLGGGSNLRTLGGLSRPGNAIN